MQLIKPRVVPVLDENFRPAALADRNHRRVAGHAWHPVRFALEQGDGSVFVFSRTIRGGDHFLATDLRYLERQVKFALWAFGGHTLYIDAPLLLVSMLRDYHFTYVAAQQFDADVMETVYGRPFRIEHASGRHFPEAAHKAVALGRNTGGSRIAIDLGASDIKYYAEIDGVQAAAGEIRWDPKPQSNPEYHYSHILQALRVAARAVPRVDGVGVSSAGIWVQNRCRIASLFRGVAKREFEGFIVRLFERIALEDGFRGVPIEVANDGDVSALAASMSLGVNSVLGIALGSSVAAGYVDANGNITTRLNELAFVPLDVNPRGVRDEWSGDCCMADYLAQRGVNRLLEPAGIEVSSKMDIPERLVHVQELMSRGDDRAHRIYQTIGAYFGYALGGLRDWYDYRTCLVMGRVTTGLGGEVIVGVAKEVLKEEFPEANIDVRLPDEASRRVGQAAAAASLPRIAVTA